MRTVPPRRPQRRAVAAVAGALSGAVVLGACAGTADVSSSVAGGDVADAAASPSGGDVVVATPSSSGGDVVVATASSLSDVFEDLGAAWRRSATGADDPVTFDAASSSALAVRIAEGAPYDVFASADLATMQRLRADGLLVDAPQVFARTTLVLVVPADDPAGVRSLADLARPGLRVALAAPSVPLGRYTREAFARVGADVPPTASREANARAVLAKVRLGEVDAGVVYRPDVATAGGALRTVELPAAAQVTVEYPIAVPTTSDDRAAAADFVRFVLSDRGRAVLVAAGYEVP